MSAQSPIRTVAEQLAILAGNGPKPAAGRGQPPIPPARSVAEQLAILVPDPSMPDLLLARRLATQARLAGSPDQVQSERPVGEPGHQERRRGPADQHVGGIGHGERRVGGNLPERVTRSAAAR
jgi:hypothetical protein